MHEFFFDFRTGLSFLSFIPKAYRTIANRDTLKDISLASRATHAV
jgi:hypothetical protein